MMKRLLLLISICALITPFKAVAQDTIPDLIISEARYSGHPTAYIELCNMADTAMDLTDFVLRGGFGGVQSNQLVYLPGIVLEPKETFVISNTYEEPLISWVELNAVSDKLLYQPEAGELFDTGVLTDSVGEDYSLLRDFGGKYGAELWYKYDDTDSIVIDCFNWNLDANGDHVKVQWGLPIAGVVEPLENHTVVRKANITSGNMGNWNASRGVDAGDSEWLLVDHKNVFNMGLIPDLPYRTIGNHGDYSLDVTAINPGITLDLANGTLTVPWGIVKKDPLVEELAWGDGMAWWYVEKPVFEDSVHTIVQTGDVLIVKALGNQLTEKELVITVLDPADEMNLVFPKRNLRIPDLETDPPGTVSTWGNARYYVTQDMPEIDSIGSVAFATRVDTLYKYLEWAPEASVEITWVDGNERIDLMTGDKLVVTAKSGAKKEYFIDVLDYAPGEEALLTAITWPDISQKDLDFDYTWQGDTIPGFSSAKYQYNITLHYENTTIPALKAYASDVNATIDVESAVSLSGGFEERTTVITVISESGLVESTYSITFKLDELPANKQKFKGDPFFTEYHNKFSTQAEILEICNPGNVPLDLGNYLIARGLGSPADVVQADLPFSNRYQLYVPGFRFTDDTTGWETTDNKILMHDPEIDPTLEPDGDVFVIGGRKLNGIENKFEEITPDWWDISFPEDRENEWGLTFETNAGVTSNQKDIVYYLFHIEGDSVLAGKKAIGDMEDLVLVDALGYADGTWFGNIGGYTWTGDKGHKLIRKPGVWHGNPDYTVSGGTTPENSEWTWANAKVEGIDWMEHISNVGSHILDPVTAYMSTVSSLVYLVDPGYQGDLGINGISNGETVELFKENLIPGDTAQDLKVLSATDGSEKDPATAVAEGDSLVVTSADGKSVTKYLLSVAALNNNTKLLAKTGGGLTVADGKVSGFDPGATLESVYTNVEAESELSLINIVDETGALVPLKLLNSDGEYVPVLASEAISIEVVAQNGDKKKYQLSLGALASDAYVISSLYGVDQENLAITGVEEGTAVSAFFASIEVVPGATATLQDRAGYDRTLGTVSLDDVLEVVSEDKSKTVVYDLNFSMEQINSAPSVSVSSADITAQVGVAVSVSATATDDGLPNPPGAMTYLWSVTSGEAASVTIASEDQAATDVTFSAAGSYVLQVAASDGELEAVATVNVVVNAVGVDEEQASAFRMFPNPATDMLMLEMLSGNAVESTVKIYNLTGKAVFNGMTSDKKMVIDVNQFEPGIYFVTVESGLDITTRKLSILSQ